jgi:hypothetical protein
MNTSDAIVFSAKNTLAQERSVHEAYFILKFIIMASFAKASLVGELI